MAATWTSIPDGDVDPESPITTALMQALRDNPEGIAGGVSGAPRIQTDALASRSVTSAKLPELVASSTPVTGFHPIHSTSSTSYLTEVQFRIGQSGSVRINLSHRTDDSSYESRVQILKNGTEIKVWSTASTTYQFQSVDISVAFGDELDVRQRITNSAATTYMKNCILRCDGWIGISMIDGPVP